MPIFKEAAGFLLHRLRRRTSDGRYRPEIDGLRFFAIAVVVFGHLFERSINISYNFGYTRQNAVIYYLKILAKPGAGVLLFFTVSGFIITSQFLKHQQDPLSARFLKSYFGRRVLRIEPPYLLLLLLTYLALELSSFRPNSVRFSQSPQSLTTSLLASIAYCHDWLFNDFPRLFPPGWSLEVEVQFYILAPVLFFLYFKIGHAKMRAIAAASLLVGSVLVALLTPPSTQVPYLQQSIVMYSPFFFLGMILADIQFGIVPRLAGTPAIKKGADAVGWLGLALFIGANAGISVRDVQTYDLYFVSMLLAVTLMFFGVLSHGGSFCRLCSLPFISITGGACYSIYLTHLHVLSLGATVFQKAFHDAPLVPVVVAFTLTQIPAVLLAGFVFFLLVERPCMTPNWPVKLWNALLPHKAPPGSMARKP